MRRRVTKWFVSLNAIGLVLWGALGYAQNDPHIIWTENEAGRHSLKMRSKSGSRWKAPAVEIEASRNPIIGPTAALKPNGDAGVAWTELDGVHGRLRYRMQRNGKWQTVGDIPTQTSSDMAPAMLADHEGVLWMVWSGTDESDDDIYFSRWIGNQWQRPQRVNEDDQWPDILPALALDPQNRIRTTWQGYDGERYVRYSAHWTGRGWSPEEKIGENLAEPRNSTAALPGFIPETSQGYLFQGKSSPGRKFRKIRGRSD